jgi:hypothetical protein
LCYKNQHKHRSFILLIIPIYAKVSKNKTVINEFDAFKALLAQGIDIDIGQ